MIRRRNSIAMCEILYGNSRFTSSLIRTLGAGLTHSERMLVRKGSYAEINAIFSTDDLFQTRKQTRRANWRRRHMRSRLETLRSRPTFRAVFGRDGTWNEPEWEFPKGRRQSKHEPDVQCALREFTEETGYPTQDIHLCTPRINTPFVERYRSINGIQYENTYYVARMLTQASPVFDPVKNIYQRHEISDLRWLNVEDVPKLLRPSQSTKLQCLRVVQQYLTTHVHTKTSPGEMEPERGRNGPGACARVHTPQTNQTTQ